MSSDGFSLSPGVGEPHGHRPNSLDEAIAVVERYGSVWRQDDKENGPVDKFRMGASQVYDEDLIHTIGKFKDLKHLELYNTDISDRTLRALEMLDNLQYLDLSGTDVTEDGIKRLQNHLPNLEIRI